MSFIITINTNTIINEFILTRIADIYNNSITTTNKESILDIIIGGYFDIIQTLLIIILKIQLVDVYI